MKENNTALNWWNGLNDEYKVKLMEELGLLHFSQPLPDYLIKRIYTIKTGKKP